MRIVGLVSTWNEGRLVHLCVKSLLDACPTVVVFDGPFGATPPEGESSDFEPFKNDPRVIVKRGRWDTQAEKLNAMVAWACNRYAERPLWGMNLDGDEVLIDGEFLPDVLRKASELDPTGEKGTVPRMFVQELDSSTVVNGSHLVRLDVIDRYLVSGTQVLLKTSSIPVAFANTPANRWPMQGEPHILHRSRFRLGEREALEARAHISAEANWFETAAAAAGLSGIEAA